MKVPAREIRVGDILGDGSKVMIVNAYLPEGFVDLKTGEAPSAKPEVLLDIDYPDGGSGIRGFEKGDQLVTVMRPKTLTDEQLQVVIEALTYAADDLAYRANYDENHLPEALREAEDTTYQETADRYTELAQLLAETA